MFPKVGLPYFLFLVSKSFLVPSVCWFPKIGCSYFWFLVLRFQFSGSLCLLVSKDRVFLFLVSSFKSLVVWFSGSLFLLVSKDRFFLFLVVERLGRQDLASPRPPLLPATAPIRLAQNLFSPKNCFEPQNPGLKRQGLAASLEPVH